MNYSVEIQKGPLMRHRAVFAADNLEALGRIDSDSVTLVYLDPPFNSGRTYEALLGGHKHGSRRAFSDSWVWTAEVGVDLARLGSFVPQRVVEFVRSIVAVVGEGELAAYLVMMTSRLGELHRVLAPHGSLYLHCDPAASHYLKIILDLIFGPENFRNELIWKRTHAHSGSRRFGPVHDTVLFYTKTPNYVWNQGYAPYSDEYVRKYFRQSDDRGAYQLITCTGPGARPGTRADYEWRGVRPPTNRHWAWTRDVMEQMEADGRLVYSRNGVPRLKRYVSDGQGVRLQDLWTDIGPLGAHATERTGYDTQKPLALLERIINASSRPGDLVLDPFSGSGTTAVAAERLGRSWIAMDSDTTAAALTLSRVRAAGTADPVTLTGFPNTVSSARRMAREDQTAFAVWGTGMLATLLEKTTLSSDVAFGRSSYQRALALVSLESWVPLKHGAALASRGSSGREASVVVGLVGSRDDARALDALEHGLSAEVLRVPLEDCVSTQALARGAGFDFTEVID